MTRVLVVTAGECEAEPGQKCVVAAITVADHEEAQRVKDRLLPGESAHLISLSPASDYLG